jgi:hypothetical protein
VRAVHGCPGSPRRRLVAVTLLSLTLALTFGATAGAAIDPIDLGPTSDAYFFAVNDSGQVGGVQFPEMGQTAIRWQDGAITKLGSGESRGQAIDDAGTVYGYEETDHGSGLARYPAKWDGASNVVSIDYNYPGGEGGGYWSASPNGTAAGAWYSPGGTVYGFVTPPGGTPQNFNGWAESVNDRGHVAGPGTFYDGTSVLTTDVNPGPGAFVQGHALNGNDDLVGSHNSGTRSAVIRHGDGSMEALAELPGAALGDAYAQSINDAGAIVGTSSHGGAMIWTDPHATPTLLDAQLPAGSPWHLTEAYQVNDGGWMLGWGTLNGVQHTWLIRGRAQGTLAGTVADRQGKALGQIKVKVTGHDDDGTAVAQTLTTDNAGRYSGRVAPGTYTVQATGDPAQQVGGAWAAVQCAGTAPGSGAGCALRHVDGNATLGSNFTYNSCGAANDLPPGVQPTGCPIIFVPGILGSVVACNGESLWPHLPRARLDDMLLKADGKTNAGAPGSCNANASTPPGFDGVVQSVAGVDAYGAALAFIQRIAPGSAYAYPYDWRKGVDQAIGGLDATIDQALKDTGAQKVVLWAHSMGGLVSRSYIDDTGRAKKVARLLTLGTPYLGSPKSMFSLLEGDTDTPAGSTMDLIVNAGELQRATRNYQGLFWLYPSAPYGSWLRLSGQTQNAAGVERFVASLGATPALLRNAQAGHRAIDGFKSNGVKYEAMVGTGVPTVQTVTLQAPFEGVIGFGGAEIGDGDGTVPERSETQNAPDGATANDGVPLHYICGIEHGGESGNAGVQARIKDFLVTGGAIAGPESSCPVSGTIVKVYNTHAKVAGASAAAAGAMTPAAAKRAGLADVTTLGQSTMIVTDARHPVSIALPLGGGALTVTPFTNNKMGKAHTYKPATGTVTLDQAGTVRRKGKLVKPGKADATAPKTTARVRRKGKKSVVTLKARAAGTGVAATWVTIGSAKPKRYKKALTLTAKQLKALRFSSIDRAGNLESARRVSR